GADAGGDQIGWRREGCSGCVPNLLCRRCADSSRPSRAFGLPVGLRRPSIERQRRLTLGTECQGRLISNAPTQVALAWAFGPPVGLRRLSIGRQRRLRRARSAQERLISNQRRLKSPWPGPPAPRSAFADPPSGVSEG
ncbi:MAG: hypothetical protein N3B68_09175, partial [Anaerolineae bacterium]|nr:hypothetical protein [Anaerolineae bacterium]